MAALELVHPFHVLDVDGDPFGPARADLHGLAALREQLAAVLVCGVQPGIDDDQAARRAADDGVAIVAAVGREPRPPPR
jgi:hypothetical protein